MLRLHKHLDARLRLVELRFDGKTIDIERAWPEVTGDRQDVIVSYDRTEGSQIYILPRVGDAPAVRKRRLFDTTDTLESAMAAEASIGESCQPVKG